MLEGRVRLGKTVSVLADTIVCERHRFAHTLRSVGADAPTLIDGWTAHDVAAHVVSLDRFRGAPTFVGRRVVSRGVRLNDVASRSAGRALRSSKRPGFEWALDELERKPPELLLRPSVLPVGLFEVFVHHEDVRRFDRVGSTRVAPEGLSEVVPWLLRYHRRLLKGTRLVVRTSAGEWVEGSGPAAVLAGPVDEVVLWLAGRREVSTAEVTGEAAATIEVTALQI